MGKTPQKHSGDDLRRSKLRLRAQVRIPKDLPITQIEVEVIAGLLDDWETVVPAIAEAKE
jgi:hypothetical protein